jgi:hypothetical protein
MMTLLELLTRNALPVGYECLCDVFEWAFNLSARSRTEGAFVLILSSSTPVTFSKLPDKKSRSLATDDFS